jgi:Putative metallopeptidase
MFAGVPVAFGQAFWACFGIGCLLAGCGPASRPAVHIEYVAPTQPEQMAVADMLKRHRVLETMQQYLSPLLLPSSLTLKFETCGVANASYSEGVVSVCYEYVDELIRHAPTTPTMAGVSREDTIVGPTLEVILHEVAHAAFDLFEIPILGREEDAADQVAALLLINLTKEEAFRAVAGTAYMYFREAQGPPPEMTAFAKLHGLPAQRFYNLLCLAYGADPALFGVVIEREYLPKARAETCAEEYEQVVHAFTKLIGPHLEASRVEEVRKRRLLKFDDWKVNPVQP